MAGRGRREWSLLPPELLHMISETLTEISDRHRFRSVCPKWRAAAGPIPPQPRHLPYLLLVPYPNDSPCHVITPLLHHQIYTLRTPFSSRLSSSFSFGSSFGLIVNINASLFDFRSAVDHTITVVDPLPGGRWTTLPILLSPEDADFPLAKIVSADPDLVIILLTGFSRAPYIWRNDQCEEILLPDNEIMPCDVTLYKGELYIVDDYKTYVVNSSDFKLNSTFSCPQMGDVDRYLVESSSGDLLMVITRSEEAWDDEELLFDLSITVFRLVGTKWEKTTNIRDDTLFIDGHNSMCFPSDGYKINCVYFVYQSGSGCKLYIYDIAADKVVDSFDYGTGNCRALWVSHVQ